MNYLSNKSQKTLGWRWLAVLLLAIIAATHLLRTALRAEESRAIIVAALVFIGVAGIEFLRRRRTGQEPATPAKRFIPWMTIPLLLAAIWAASNRLFGKFDVSATLFHVNHGLSYDGVGDDIAEFSAFLLVAIIIIASIIYLGRRTKWLRWADMALALPLLLINPISSFFYDSYLNPQASDKNLSAQYAPIAETAIRPEQKKNLILIYLESIEETYDAPIFDGVFDDLNALAAQGTRLSGVQQIEDTGWTIAGLVASQCGVPLLSYGLVMRNRMKNIETFMPGAECLGTVLQADGYETVFYGGARLEFAGKGRFLETHGYDRRYGLLSFDETQRGPISKWGIYDDKIFELALEDLKQLNKSGEPFMMSILTLAAHAPDGYPAPICYDTIPNAAQMDALLLSIRCTSQLTQKFLDEAKAQGLLEDTVIVLMSDHLGHKSFKTERLNKLTRQNFLAILGDDISPARRDVHGSMIDLYPTILEALGYELPNHRAGMGVSLLSGQDTLLTQWGVKPLEQAITGDTDLRQQLWGLGVTAE